MSEQPKSIMNKLKDIAIMFPVALAIWGIAYGVVQWALDVNTSITQTAVNTKDIIQLQQDNQVLKTSRAVTDSKVDSIYNTVTNIQNLLMEKKR